MLKLSHEEGEVIVNGLIAYEFKLAVDLTTTRMKLRLSKNQPSYLVEEVNSLLAEKTKVTVLIDKFLNDKIETERNKTVKPTFR